LAISPFGSLSDAARGGRQTAQGGIRFAAPSLSWLTKAAVVYLTADAMTSATGKLLQTVLITAPP